MSNNVIHLEFRNPKMQDDTMSFMSCKSCRNKTFVFMTDIVGYFPLIKCAACGQHIGRTGWVHDDDPLVGGAAS